jgi:hypothetical protein
MNPNAKTKREQKAYLTRAKAERALSAGADPTLDIYTKHPNKHVRAKAAKRAV